MNRHKMDSDERSEIKEIEKSLRTSTYLDDKFWEAAHQGIKPQQANVPNYKQPTKGEILSEVASESGGMHMDLGGLYNTASQILGPEQTKTASADTMNPRQSGENTFEGTRVTHPSLTVSRNQAMAIKKYPALIEFLGQEEGSKIANNISEHLNVHIAKRIEKNTKEAHDDARECGIDRQNFKQYFKGKDWVCRVTASGPFKGDEVIYYSREKDAAHVLRRLVSGEKVRYEDISAGFNVIYEAGQTETPPAEAVEVSENIVIKDCQIETPDEEIVVAELTEEVAVTEERESDTENNGTEINRAETDEAEVEV